MAKSGRGGNKRSLPSTPQPASPQPDPDHRDVAHGVGPRGVDSAAGPAQGSAGSGPAESDASEREPEYLIHGTGCSAGHARGHELDAGRLGRVPSRRATRIGLALILWCVLGVGLLVDLRWLSFGLQLLALWLAFSAIVQRRAGHVGRCWRTRTWRHAWGGFAPSPSDPTRPAGT